MQLTCIASKGDHPISFSWLLNGFEVGAAEASTVNVGQKTSLLIIQSVTSRHAGLYTCRAVNLGGESNRSAELHVKGMRSSPLLATNQNFTLFSGSLFVSFCSLLHSNQSMCFVAAQLFVIHPKTITKMTIYKQSKIKHLQLILKEISKLYIFWQISKSLNFACYFCQVFFCVTFSLLAILCSLCVVC